MSLEAIYEELAAAATDIKDHIPALRDLAAGVRVVEFGTRRGVSTMVMLTARPVFLHTYDLLRHADVDQIQDVARFHDIPFQFFQEDIDKLSRITPCDFVFIDAMHNGNSAAIQLRLAHCAGAKRIALHDTDIFGRSGDLPGTPGILDAVDGFRTDFPEWQIIIHRPECYGLTVLAHP